MLLPEAKERELRFRLALRMGLPIFFLTLLLAVAGFSEYFEHIPLSFYITALLLLGVMIYFIFFLIYAGYDERVTDPVTGTFDREYLISYLKKQMDHAPYTLLLISIDNLNDINDRYGTKNGDRVLREFGAWSGKFLQSKGIDRFPIGHYKGGDFLVGLKGPRQKYLSLVDLLSLKAESYMIDDIELQVSAAVIDTEFSYDTEQLIAQLFEKQLQNRAEREESDDEEFDPSELEATVAAAVKEQRFSLMFQEVHEQGRRVMLDTSVKLFGKGGKLIHQKSYIPVINRLGLSRAFDLMVLEKIIHLCETGKCQSIFVISLFPSTVRNHHFFEKVQMLFTENRAARGRILFMLAEREYHNQIHRYNDILQSYRRMGLLIGLDRLGSHHTTMLYMREMEVDVVRYDMHYGKHIADTRTQALIRGLDLSAHCLGVKSWIKMIEDYSELQIADDIGINFVQGNHIGRLASLEDFLEKNE